MEASVTGNKRARVTRFLRAALTHILIDLFLAELLIAVFLVTQLPIPVRLDAADFSTLTIRESSGLASVQALKLSEPKEIAEYCELFDGLRAPKERHPNRYRTLGGVSFEFVFMRENGEVVTVGVTSGTPLLSVRKTSDAEPQYYHVGEDVTAHIYEDMQARFDSALRIG